MSGFVIVRHKKLKSVGQIQAAIHHNDRTTTPKNADPERAHLNSFEGGGMEKLRQNLATVTQASTAKNPVLAIEYIVTATPEQINAPSFDRAGYFKAARDYLDNLLGVDNLIHTATHHDERTAHAHYIYTPIIEVATGTRKRSVVVGKDKDGKQKREVREFPTKAGRALNGKKYTGRNASIELQTTFAELVGKPFGLRRGIAGSRAKHVEIKSFYGKLQQDLDALRVSMESLTERQASQDTRGNELEGKEQALEREKKLLEEHRQQMAEHLQEALEQAERVEQDEADLNERQKEFYAEVERQVSELEAWDLDLQSREAELAANPPTPALKSRSKVLDALVAALPETLIRELPAELRKAVRGVQERNNNQGLSR